MNKNSSRNVQVEDIYTLKEAGEEAPEIIGVKTGVPGLDEMFYVAYINKQGKPQKKPLGGYPLRSVMNITGIPDTGKSLMAEQFAVTQASLGNTVCFVTVEQPAAFLAAGLRQRALALNINVNKIEENIIIIDAASNSVLRDDLNSLGDTLAYVYKTHDITSTIIDSVTRLYEAREMLARQVIRYLYNFMKKWYQTALFVSQKRSGHEELTAEAAGGYAVGHIVDGNIVVSKKEILSRFDASLYKKEIGDIIRLLRIDGCRVSGHDTKTHLFEINELGIATVGPTLEELIRKEVKK